MSIYNEKHIHEVAYLRGIRDFRLGGYVLAPLKSYHKKLLGKRIFYLINDKPNKAGFIENHFNVNKLYLEDVTVPIENEDGTKSNRLHTKVYRIGEPTCPYRPNTLWSKEWQRGVNFAYADVLKTNILREDYEHYLKLPHNGVHPSFDDVMKKKEYM